MKQDRTTEQSEKLRQMLREAALRRPFTEEEKALQAKLDEELARSKGIVASIQQRKAGEVLP